MKRSFILLAVLLIAFAFTPNIFAQQTSPDQQQAESGKMPGHEGHLAMAPEKMGQEEPADIMAQHDQMMSMMKKMDQQLENKVSAMNAAAGEKEQIDAMKAVINELVSQRKQMHQKMLGMQGKMCKMMGRMKTKDMEEGPIKMKMGKKGEDKEKNMIIIIQE